MPTRFFFAVVLCACLAVGPVRASEAEIPLDLQAALIIKVLAFDQSLAQQDGNLVIGIVIDESTAGRESMLSWEFGRLSGQSVQQRTITHVVVIDGSESDGIGDNIAASGANVLFLPHSSKKETVREVAYQATQLQLPTVAGSRECAKAGAAIGLAIQEGRASIVLNLRSSRKQGMQLTDELIQMSQVIRR